MTRYPRLSSLLTLSGLLLASVLPLAAKAETAPSLIKGSGSTVYALTSDGERYAFPSLSIFNSWYADTRGITHVKDDELAALPLRGEVAYRPGSVLLKTPTDLRVYAVTQKHMLRWITTESIAKELYGATWAKQVVDVPTDYLGQFSLGAPIESAKDYSPTAERMQATLLDDGFINTVTVTPAIPPSTSSSTASLPPSLEDLLKAVPAPSDKIAVQFSSSQVPAGSRVSFQSTIFAPITIQKHTIYALAQGVSQPIIWKNCDTQALCASSAPFWRKTIFYAQFVSEGITYTSKPVTLDVVGGEPPRPVLSFGKHMGANQQEIILHVPQDETARLTAIVDGTTIEDPVLGMCSDDCSFTVEVHDQASITAFTWLGGVYEPSNTLQLKVE